MNLKIVMVDDHKMITDAYRTILSKYFSKKAEIITLNSLESAYKYIFVKKAEGCIDIIVLDISMPAFIEKNINSGEDLAHLIRLKYPKVKIVFISGYHDLLTLKRIKHGIGPEGLIDKIDLNACNLANVFRLIIDGDIYISETIKKKYR